MKRFMSAVLIVAMLLSLAVVSSAGKHDYISEGFSTGGIVGAESDDGIHALAHFLLNGVEDSYVPASRYPAEYGSEVFVSLLWARDEEDFSLNMIRNIKVKAEWEEGGDLVESVAVTVISEAGDGRRQLFPVIKIKLKDSEDIAQRDVIGTLTLNKSKGDAEYRIKDAKVPVQFSVDHWISYRKEMEALNLTIEEDTQIVYPGNPYLLKFDYDDEVEFSFGAEANEGTFTVDVSGQGKLLLLFDSVPNAAVEAANPTANMVFFGFNDAKFNRTGEFFYETETSNYIYQLVDGMPVEIAGAVYDEADEGFRFYTRTLGRYVISDIPLVAPNAEAAKAAVLSGTELHTYLDRVIYSRK